LLNGNTGVAKAYIAEITDSSNQARAFGLFGLMWGVGGVAGSVLGGFASEPAVHYPWLFSSDGIFARFPFLLPNLVAASMTFVGFISSIIFIEENVVDYSSIEMDEKILIKKEEVAGSDGTFNREDSTASLLTDEEKDRGNLEEFEDVDTVISSPVDEDDFFHGKRSKFFLFDSLKKKFAELREKSVKKKSRPAKELLTDRLVIMTCSMYAILGFYCTLYDEVMPLWVLQDVSTGGLGFSPQDIGIMNCIAGVSTILMQMFIFHRIATRFGLIHTFFFGQCLMVPILMFIPCINLLEPYGYVVVWFSLALAVSLRQVSTQCCFSSVMALITNSVHYGDIGAVNGLGQSLVALLRAIGPAFGASLLSWSFTNGLRFPFNHFFIFILSLVISTIPTIMCMRLPEELNVPRNEVNKSRSAPAMMSEI